MLALPRHPGRLRARLTSLLPLWQRSRACSRPGSASALLAVGSRDSLDLDVLANFAKLAAVTLLALLVPRPSSRRVAWVVLVALIIPWVDAYSVWRGPTKHIVDEAARASSRRSRSPSRSRASDDRNLGLPDLLFFALFLAAAARFGPARRG